MKKIKVGVLGAYRGTGMINYCKVADNAELPRSLDGSTAVFCSVREKETSPTPLPMTRISVCIS